MSAARRAMEQAHREAGEACGRLAIVLATGRLDRQTLEWMIKQLRTAADRLEREVLGSGRSRD